MNIMGPKDWLAPSLLDRCSGRRQGHEEASGASGPPAERERCQGWRRRTVTNRHGLSWQYGGCIAEVFCRWRIVVHYPGLEVSVQEEHELQEEQELQELQDVQDVL